MKPGENMKVKAMANEFLIWREASSVGWDCTIPELADATGLLYPTVLGILKRKGWYSRVLHGHYNHGGFRLGVDQAMAIASPQGRGRA